MRSLQWWRWLAVCLLLPVMLLAADAVPVPALTSPVTDLTQTLTAEQLSTLDAQLRAFSTRKGSQFAVLLVATTQPETIEQYSIRVVDAWKLGRKDTDDGVLLLIAKDDRAVRIEVGYGLEGVLNDATANRIIRQLIVPQFRANNYFQGISDASARIMQLIDGEVLPEPADTGAASGRSGNLPWPLLLFVAMVGGSVARSWFGRMGAAGLTAGVVGVLTWVFMSSLLFSLVTALFAFVFVLGGGGSGGGWSSGPRGGWSSRSGGGFGGGGFSGGGGGFGGGGASGRW
jgi:uncharacterized protein